MRETYLALKFNYTRAKIKLKLSKDDVEGLYCFCLVYIHLNEEFLYENCDKGDRMCHITETLEKKMVKITLNDQQNFTLTLSFADALCLHNACFLESEGISLDKHLPFVAKQAMDKLDQVLKSSNAYKHHRCLSRRLPKQDVTIQLSNN